MRAVPRCCTQNIVEAASAARCLRWCTPQHDDDAKERCAPMPHMSRVMARYVQRLRRLLCDDAAIRWWALRWQRYAPILFTRAPRDKDASDDDARDEDADVVDMTTLYATRASERLRESFVIILRKHVIVILWDDKDIEPLRHCCLHELRRHAYYASLRDYRRRLRRICHITRFNYIFIYYYITKNE